MTSALIHPFEGWETCRQWAVAFFALVLVWAATAAFSRLAVVMRAGGGAGIVAFEFAGSRARAAQILAGWSEGGRGARAAAGALLVDVPFLAAYGVGLALFAAVVAESVRRHEWTGAAYVAALVGWAFLLAAAADLFEDLALAVVLFQGRHVLEQVRETWPRTAQAFSIVKFILLAISIWVLLVIATVGTLSLLADALIGLFPR